MKFSLLLVNFLGKYSTFWKKVAKSYILFRKKYAKRGSASPRGYLSFTTFTPCSLRSLRRSLRSLLVHYVHFVVHYVHSLFTTIGEIEDFTVIFLEITQNVDKFLQNNNIRRKIELHKGFLNKMT